MIQKRLNIKDVFALAVENHQKNNLKIAANLYWEILKAFPNNTLAINGLCSLFSNNELKHITQIDRNTAKYLLVMLFRRNDVDHKDIFLTARFLLFSEKNITEKKIKEIVYSDYPLLKNNIVVSLIKEELFQLMLQKTLITDHLLEKLLTKIRKEILFASVGSQHNSLDEIFEFVVSFSEQCFLNEYIYTEEKKEVKLLSKLKKSLKFSKNINELKIAVLGCYLPLNLIKGAVAKLTKYKSKNTLFNDLILMQIQEPLLEKKISNSIKSLGKISDITSQKVKKQYEQNPYPRWRYTYLNLPNNLLNIVNSLVSPNKIKLINKINNPEVLIAGCGTGKQIIYTKGFLNANITGIDLSLSSLAYAKRKSEEVGLKNINFLQADILELKKLNKKFDLIESVGVIHHMKDPLKGLKVLKDLLKPHGLLRLGIYSELARDDIIKIRKLIKKEKYKNTKKDIKKFREIILDEKSNKLLKKVLYRRDFYSTSTARDLMFHVKEKRFTLPELSKMLEELDLQFIGFDDFLAKRKYKNLYPLDIKNTSLSNWHQFEKKNPNIFMGMYNFFVKKK